MTGHLTPQQAAAYRSGTPAPDEFLLLDDHLAACPECRSLLADVSDPATAIRLLQLDFSSAQRPLAAAMAIAALGVASWLAIRSPAVRKPPIETAKIPPVYQAEVRTAIDSGILHIPASITGATGAPIPLRSESKTAASSAFHLVSPTATAVIDDAPLFQWTPLRGATYSISVYDGTFNQIASAESLHVTEWRPDKPFPRGTAYLWEVRAVSGAHIERAPTATEPEARFAILTSSDVQRLNAARAAMPDEPLALGIIYADAGALADAAAELQQAAKDPQQKSTAEKLLAHLK